MSQIVDFLISFFVALIVVVIVAFIALLGIGIYESATSETFDLRKSEWECTASVSQTTYVSVLVGKVPVMTPVTSDVCVKYERAVE